MNLNNIIDLYSMIEKVLIGKSDVYTGVYMVKIFWIIFVYLKMYGVLFCIYYI